MQGHIVFIFKSALNPGDKDFGDHMAMHGDGVRDGTRALFVLLLRPSTILVAFTVDDARAIYNKAVSRGAKSIREPWVERDEHGEVVMATVATVTVLFTFFLRFNKNYFFFISMVTPTTPLSSVKSTRVSSCPTTWP